MSIGDRWRLEGESRRLLENLNGTGKTSMKVKSLEDRLQVQGGVP